MNPEEFEKSFLEWVKTIQELTRRPVIAIEGRQSRGSKDIPEGKEAIYMVSAWATENQMVLGQRKVDAKSNEITAVPQLLKLLDIHGCIVSLDALSTQTRIAKRRIEQGVDYILAVKESQGSLYEDIHEQFEDDPKGDFKDAPYSNARTVNQELT